MKVFIVDDDTVYRMIASRTLNLINSSLVIDECENGEVGLSCLKKQNNLHQRIVVFLDINMPVLDGWSFLEQLEKNNFYKLSKLNIYVVSSSTDKSDILKAKEYGFVKGFIHKPLTREDIKAIVAET
jgi:CheY-like chemotaxis protein